MCGDGQDSLPGPCCVLSSRGYLLYSLDIEIFYAISGSKQGRLVGFCIMGYDLLSLLGLCFHPLCPDGILQDLLVLVVGYKGS